MTRAPWLIGGGALAAYWWARSDQRAPRNVAAMLSGRWVWPVASWYGRPPTISDGFDSPRPGLPRHGGVDIMFRRVAGDELVVGTTGTKLFVMPDDQPVLAASDGVVWSAMKTPRGYAVVIDHGPRTVATFYTHLDRMLVTPTARGASKQRVTAGQMIGTVGFDPLDARKVRHLLCGAAHKRCNAERPVMRSRLCRRAIARNRRHTALHITVASRRSR